MGLKPTLRKYHMTDAALIQTADRLISVANRDLTLLANRGVTAAQLSDFQDTRDSFADSDTDEELAGAVTTAAEDKTAKRKVLEAQIRQLRGMAESEYGHTGTYRTFGFDELSRQTDDGLYRMGKRVHRIATAHLADLTGQGLNAAFLTTLKGFNDDFDVSIDAVGDAERYRDTRTQQRIQLGNDLFDVVSEIAKTGKYVFQDIDEAKYNDYIVYDVAPVAGETPAP